MVGRRGKSGTYECRRPTGATSYCEFAATTRHFYTRHFLFFLKSAHFIHLFYFLFPLPHSLFQVKEKKPLDKNHLWKIKRWIFFFPLITFQLLLFRWKRERDWTVSCHHDPVAENTVQRHRAMWKRWTYKIVRGLIYNTQFQQWMFIIPIGLKLGCLLLLMFGLVRCLVNSGWCSPKHTRYW